MGTVLPGDGYYTLVNVFTTEPVDQQAIYDAVVEATDVIEKFPGFISANVHRSHDGRRVVNYAQWRSKEDFDAMHRHPDVQAHFKACRAITDDIEPIFCRVSYVHRAADPAGGRHDSAG
ncbi:antibiotic biosynthesis monooxygenase (plasmid) [Streptomyces sp. CG1]|uniref:antibiotic biosynthesis monooxygenase family protein n=1 Tax=Streptomyces sp. CG1 TaxID=1287523 RepID=UPI0034E1CC77